MCGWVYLPRFIDKVRLHLAGRLHEDYQTNLTRGFDGIWLEEAGVDADEFIEVVRNSLTDGEVFDWVRKNANNSEAAQERVRKRILDRGINDEFTEKLAVRKAESGLSDRDDIIRFVDYIDADEGRI